jgi:hypothetical protein
MIDFDDLYLNCARHQSYLCSPSPWLCAHSSSYIIPCGTTAFIVFLGHYDFRNSNRSHRGQATEWTTLMASFDYSHFNLKRLHHPHQWTDYRGF